uniref:Uncharacterized protein n=1 Tax=viral metagenome TaxID=1070528 RepID=A0A6M3KTT6_9ZZZZ
MPNTTQQKPMLIFTPKPPDHVKENEYLDWVGTEEGKAWMNEDPLRMILHNLAIMTLNLSTLLQMLRPQPVVKPNIIPGGFDFRKRRN